VVVADDATADAEHQRAVNLHESLKGALIAALNEPPK
jgi:hypothetical protein